MGIFSKLAASADLVGGLSARLGVDMNAPMMRNPEQAAIEYRGMVLRCAGCTDQADCAERQANSDRFDAAPDYCLNKDILDQAR
ncbi:DUF6455 family protein [Rhodobacteraceae bacterium LMO-12]|nr:DUF6455 family protein [Rhodobacteraceae bacterium LMO-JJ12]